jgi:hypothetical protein
MEQDYLSPLPDVHCVNPVYAIAKMTDEKTISAAIPTVTVAASSDGIPERSTTV